MSLDKAIKHNKERRKQYHGAKAIDPTCRNHGSCEWCNENRHYQSNKEIERCKCEEKMYVWEEENKD